MIETPQITVPDPPKLIDSGILGLQHSVAQSGVFDRVFGVCEPRQRASKETGALINYPALVTGGGDEIELFPDGHIGNFAFFDINDGPEIISRRLTMHEFRATISLICWFDFRTVYPGGYEDKSPNNVLETVLGSIRAKKDPNSLYRAERVFYRGSEIYTGYSNREIKDAFLMRPFGGFRIQGEIKFYHKTAC